MYLSLSQKSNTKGFYIEYVERWVYTYEGFVSHVYAYPGQIMAVLDVEKFIHWVKSISSIGIEVEKIIGQKPSIESQVDVQDNKEQSKKVYSLECIYQMISLCDFGKSLDIKSMGERYEAYMSLSLDERYKIQGDERFKKDDLIGAMRCYKLALAIKEKGNIYNNIGLIHMYRNEFDRADKAFRQGLAIKDSLEIRLNIVRRALLLKVYDVALETLEGASQLYSSWKLWYYYGVVYEAIDRHEEALTAYIRCFESGSDMRAFRALILLEAKMKRFEQAFMHISTADIPRDMASYLRARVYLVKEEFQQYEIFMEKALILSKNRTDMLIEMARYYCEHSQLIKAIESVSHIALEDQNKEAVIVVKAQIADTAGNSNGFTGIIEELVSKWKQEVRNNIAK